MNEFRQLMGVTCLLLVAIASAVQAAEFYACERSQHKLMIVNSVTGNVTDVVPTNIIDDALGG